MAKKFIPRQNISPRLAEVVKFVAGYQHKLQQDELPSGSMAMDSFNFMIDVDGKPTTRQGTQYFGSKSSDTDPCTSSAVLRRRDGVELPVVFYGTKAKYFNPDSNDWQTLLTGLTNGLPFAHCVMYKVTDNVNKLEFCNGTDPYFIWSGVTSKVSLFTTSTITIPGSIDLGDVGFTPTGSISVNGVPFAYTGIQRTAAVDSVTTTSITVQGNIDLSTLGFAASGTVNINGIPYVYSSLSGKTFVGVTPDPTQKNAPTVSGITSNTITINGSTTLAALNFLASGTIWLDGQAFTYTGLSSETFTGVTPDPTLNNVQTNDVILATLVNQLDIVTQSGGSRTFSGVTPDPTISGVAADQGITQLPVAYPANPRGNVMIAYNGRVVMSTKPTSALFGGGSYIGSILNDPTDFTFGVPRQPSEGYQLIMSEGGGNIMGFLQYEGSVAVFKQSAADIHNVTLDAQDFPTQQPILPSDANSSGTIGCVGPRSVCVLGNLSFFVSPLGFINTLQRVIDVNAPQTLPYSDKIDNTVKGMTWDVQTCSIGYGRNAYFWGKSGKNSNYPDQGLLYDVNYDCWYSPYVGLNFTSFFIYQNNLYGTLGTSPDVLRLNIGSTDFSTKTTLGQKINSRVTFERQNFGLRATRKQVRYLYVEGWMSLTGTITITLLIDEEGVTKSLTGTLTGKDGQYFFEPSVDGTFGADSFGTETFGGSFQTSSDMPDGTGLFRILFNFEKVSAWNIQTSFDTSDYLKILVHATDPKQSPVGFPSSNKASMG